jgi:hypothetical protein
MRKAGTLRSIFRIAIASGVLTNIAVAGPPLLCHPFEIDGAKTLPWGDGWDRPDRAYDRSHLVGDTLALLTPQTPVIVRMETLRRAALYSISDHRSGYELLARLLARAVDGDSLSTFDAGYLIETFKQAKAIGRNAIATDLDGKRWVESAMERSSDRASMEFAASLMESKWPNDHVRKAQSGAGPNTLLARNLKHFGM